MDWQLWWRQMKTWGKTNKQTKQKHAPTPTTKTQNNKKIALEKGLWHRQLNKIFTKSILNDFTFNCKILLRIIFWSYWSTLGNIFDLNPPRRLYRSLVVSGWETDPNYIIHQLITPSIWMILLWVSRSQVLYVVYIFAVIATTMMLFFVTELQYY